MSLEVPGLGLSAALVAEVFPFLLALDSELHAVSFGRALSKVCTNLAVGMPLGELFTVSRPRVTLNFEAIRRAARNTFFLDSITTQIRMRGQVLYDEERATLIFLGSPWFTDIADLEKSGLILKDFTIHDPIVDFLYMVQARTVALEDARRLGDEAVRRRDELEVINQELDEANRAKNQFLANTSHELRTPLNGIIGMGTLLSRQQLSSTAKHYCDTMLKSARVLLHVVNDILDISKIEAGKLTLETIPFDLRRLLDELIDGLAVTAHNKGLELICLLEPNVVTTLRGDPARLRQILDNLLSNALKFTQQGEVSLRVQVDALTAETVSLRFRVSDTGIGIASADQQRLFRAFSQVDDSMSRRYGGTGLGLSLCKQLVTLMGGEIGVESEAGKGSCFYFTVRFERAEDVQSKTSIPQHLLHVHALVVDDNATNREYLSTLLTQWGAETESASDALEAMQKLRQAQAQGKAFDLAILDQHMPGMTGLDLVSVVAANPRFAALQVIVLSSVDNESVSSHPQSQRVRVVLSKPVRPSLLLDCLSQMFTPFAQATLGTPVAVQPNDAVPTAQLVGQQTNPLKSGAVTSADILVVDDNPINIDVAVRMLEMLGYRADTADNGEEALLVLEKKTYRVVFMDLQMPKLDGYQATAALRQKEGMTRHTPVIAMTAHAMPKDRQRALDSGLDDYIAKPLDIDILTQIVGRWLPPAASTGAPAATPPQVPIAVSEKSVSAPSPPSEPRPPVLDSRVLEGLRKFRRPNEPELIEQIGRKYLMALPESLSCFHDALAAEDLPTLARCSHKLKSSSALIGALRLAELCGDLETQAAAGKSPAALSLVPVVIAECERVRQALEQLLSAS